MYLAHRNVLLGKNANSQLPIDIPFLSDAIWVARVIGETRLIRLSAGINHIVRVQLEHVKTLRPSLLLLLQPGPTLFIRDDLANVSTQAKRKRATMIV